jgi:polysaccharide export outer membrane protein
MATSRITFNRGLLPLLGIALQMAIMPVMGKCQATAGIAASSSISKGGSTTQSQAVSIVPKDFSELRIEPGDLLNVSVYDTPEFTNAYRVDPSGNLTIPLCGKVNVRGLTMPEAAKRLEAAFKDGQILTEPQVNVDVQQYAGEYVTVLGEVGSPGRVELIAPTHLSEVIAQVGGLTSLAGARIRIRHQGDDAGPEEEIPYFRSQSNQKAASIFVRPGDSVFVPRAGIVYVLGAVNRPGGYLMQEDGKLNVAQALALSGGTVLQANTEGLRVIRRNSDGTVLDFPLSYNAIAKGTQQPLMLQAQDIVYVPISKAKAVFSSTSGLISTATSAAIYDLR